MQAGFLAIGGGPELVRAGRLRAIAVSGPRRDPAAAGGADGGREPGIPGFDVRIGTVLLAPRGTPAEAIEGWGALVRGLLADPSTAPRFANWGVQCGGGHRGRGRGLAAQRGAQRWGEVVRIAGMKAQ